MRLLSVSLLLLFTACSNPAPELPGEKNPGTAKRIKNGVSRIVFGRFCGECAGDCAAMYTYKLAETGKTLGVDTSNGYFDDKIKEDVQLYDTALFRLADEVYTGLPATFVTGGQKNEEFGCPDCTDGCGLYVEVQQGGTVSKFRIDARDERIKGEVGEFRIRLSAIVDTMNNITRRGP